MKTRALFLLPCVVSIATASSLNNSTLSALNAPTPTDPTEARIPVSYSQEDALEHLGGRIANAARKLGMSAEELRSEILSDATLFVDESFNIGVVDPAPNAAELASSFADRSITDTTPPPTTAEEVFDLSTDPSSPLKIFLDFDGHTTSDTPWNYYSSGVPVVSSPFDLNGDAASWSTAEIAEIYRVWRAVADDFAPWQVDVTTKDPGLDGLRRNNPSDTNYGTRVVISPTNFWSPSAGGVAFLSTFNEPLDSDSLPDIPVFVFTEQLANNSKYIAEAVSHEAGHAVSLLHDGIGNGVGENAYYRGTDTWGPIMGAAYEPTYSTWSKGEYRNANNKEDDLAKIAAFIPVRVDDHGNSIGSATALSEIGSHYGRIETPADVDAFSITLDSPGALLVSGTGIGPAPNLNIGARVYNDVGQVVASSIRAGHSFNNVRAAVSPGTYTIVISGEGVDRPDYGSLGEYRLDLDFVTIEPLAIDTEPPASAVRRASYTRTLSASGGLAPYRWSVVSGRLPSGIKLSSAGVLSGRPSKTGVSTFTVSVRDAEGRTASRSYTMYVVEPLALTTSRMAPGSTGVAYSTTLGAIGGTPSYTWTISSGSLPDGLSLSPSGIISGDPVTQGTFNFTLQVADSQGLSASRSFSVRVATPLEITSIAPPEALRGTTYSASFTASGGFGTLTWKLVAGRLPSGLRLSSNGTLSGKPTRTGMSTVTVRVTDADGRAQTATYTIVVAAS